jgi:hypothetical protein
MRNGIKLMSFVWVVGCGTVNKNEANFAGNDANNTNSSTSTSTGTSTTKSAGNCVVGSGQGCIGGFISHGQSLTVNLDGATNKYTFKDAADLFDRFGEAFIEPSIKGDGRKPEDYLITLDPEVKRDNFAIGFYMFLEGTKAYDKKSITSVGNFSYDSLDGGTYNFRMIKEISLLQKPKAGGEELAQCLVFEFMKENVTLDPVNPTAQIHQLGSVNAFNFYVRRNYGKCSGSKAMSPIGPSVIPAVKTSSTTTNTTSKSASVVGGFALSGIVSPSAMTLLGDRIYITTQNCTGTTRAIVVFNKSTQSMETPLSVAGGCEGPVNSMGAQGESLYLLSKTGIIPITPSNTAVGNQVSFATLGLTSGQMTGGKLESGVFYTLDNVSFKNTKIVSFNLTGSVLQAVSLSQSLESSVGLTKMGGNYYTMRSKDPGKLSLLTINGTGTVSDAIDVSGLKSTEKAVAIESDGTYLWIVTDAPSLYQVKT